MPLAWIIWSQLTQNSANSIAKCVGFKSNMTFQIKMTKDQSFGEYFP